MKSFDELKEIISKVSDPDMGCGWYKSLEYKDVIPFTMSETHEVFEAIHNNDEAELKDELGDLLLQVMTYASIAERKGAFTIDDVVDSCAQKMIRRKQHVLGPNPIKTTKEESVRLTKEAKRQEKIAKGLDVDKPKRILDGIPTYLPALERSHQIITRACDVGFEWDSLDGVLNKIKEELEEVKVEYEENNQEALKSEIGDLLFTTAILGYYTNINPELPLRLANEKFERRFNYVESQMQKSGFEMKKGELDKMETFWQQAKQIEKQKGEKALISES